MRASTSSAAATTTRRRCAGEALFQVAEAAQERVEGEERRSPGEADERHFKGRARLPAPGDVVKGLRKALVQT
jgi:hypothetical protein